MTKQEVKDEMLRAIDWEIQYHKGKMEDAMIKKELITNKKEEEDERCM